jgi:hypothetical protein
VEVLRKA